MYSLLGQVCARRSGGLRAHHAVTGNRSFLYWHSAGLAPKQRLGPVHSHTCAGKCQLALSHPSTPLFWDGFLFVSGCENPRRCRRPVAIALLSQSAWWWWCGLAVPCVCVWSGHDPRPCASTQGPKNSTPPRTNCDSTLGKENAKHDPYQHRCLTALTTSMRPTYAT